MFPSNNMVYFYHDFYGGILMNRLRELDSLRGLAAFSVLLSHFLLVFPSSTTQKVIMYGPLRLFVAGSEAVVLFFILSGFVLSLPFLNGKKVDYKSFVLKRICRIYIPYFVAIVSAIVLCIFVARGDLPGLSNWFNVLWDLPIDPSLIVSHILFIGWYNNAEYNPVIWSLIHELRISLFFPLLMLLIIKLDWKKIIGIGFILSVVCSVLPSQFKSYPLDIVDTIFYSFMFLIGGTLAKYKDVLVSKFKQLSKKAKKSLVLLGFISYLYIKPAFLFGIIGLGDVEPLIKTIVNDWFVALGASIFIVSSLGLNSFSKILLTKPISFLGKISYSLYLYHAIVLLTMVNFLFGKLDLWQILLIAIAVSVIIATFSYHFIEKPAITLGKRLTMKKNLTTNQDQLAAS